MREYGQEYADSLTRQTGMGRCKHGNYVCQQCVKEHEARKAFVVDDKLVKAARDVKEVFEKENND